MPLELVMEAEGFQQSGDEIYAENVRAYKIFIQVMTQWRVGSTGIVGLDYNIVFNRLDKFFKDEEEWEDVFKDIRTMESAALEKLRGND